jgi:hypothetical protein
MIRFFATRTLIVSATIYTKAISKPFIFILKKFFIHFTS